MSDSLWHYASNGKPGPAPVPFATLRQMASAGQLKPADMVWTDGMPAWVAASKVEGIFAAAPAQKMFHYSVGGAQSQAAVPLATLKQMAAGGQLQPTDMVWTDGMAQWAAASTVEGIFAAAPKSASWHYTTGGSAGPAPVPFATLQQMATSGQLQPGDMVWTDGMPQWAAASTVRGLFANAPQPAYMQPFPGGVIGYQSVHTDLPPFAGFWLRFVASFIDGIIVFVPLFILLVVGLIVSGHQFSANGMDNVVFDLFVRFVFIIAGWLYGALQESSPAQATLGKRAVGIKVTDANGQRLTFARASGRFFGKILSSICMIGYIIAAFTEKKQALHDMMAGTLVVKK